MEDDSRRAAVDSDAPGSDVPVGNEQGEGSSTGTTANEQPDGANAATEQQHLGAADEEDLARTSSDAEAGSLSQNELADPRDGCAPVSTLESHENVPSNPPMSGREERAYLYPPGGAAPGPDVHTGEMLESARTSLAARLASARSDAEKHSLRVWWGVEEYRSGGFARAELAVRAYWEAWRRWMRQAMSHNRACAGHLARVAEVHSAAARTLACSFPADTDAIAESLREAAAADGDEEDDAGSGSPLSQRAGGAGLGSEPRTPEATAMLDQLRRLGTGKSRSTLFRAIYAASDLSGSQAAGRLHIFAGRLRAEALEHTLEAASVAYEAYCKEVSRDAEGLLVMLHGAAEEVARVWGAMADAYGARIPGQTGPERERRQRRLAANAVHLAKKRELAALGFYDDPWAAELVYARGCRGLLACRRAFVRGFAALFERFRRAEIRRSKATSTALELLAELQGQMLGSGIRTDAAVAAARDVDTFADFTRKVESDAYAAYRRAGGKQMPTGPNRGSFAGATSDTSGKETASGEEVSQTKPKSFLSFVSLCPADVPSPLVSPLVLRWGRGWRRTGGLFRGWSPCTIVLTMAGMLHIFEDGADMGTNSTIVNRGVKSQRKPEHGAGTSTGKASVGSRSGDHGPDSGRPRANSPGGASFPPGPPFAGLADIPDASARDRVKKCQADPAHSVCLRGCVPGDMLGTPEGSAPSTLGETKSGKPCPTAHIRRRNDLDYDASTTAEARAALEIKIIKPGMLFSSADSQCFQFESGESKAWATALHRLLVNLAQADGLVDAAQ